MFSKFLTMFVLLSVSTLSVLAEKNSQAKRIVVSTQSGWGTGEFALEQELVDWSNAYVKRIQQQLLAAYPKNYKEFNYYQLFVDRLSSLGAQLFPGKVHVNGERVKVPYLVLSKDEDEAWSKAMESNLHSQLADKSKQFKLFDVSCKQMRCVALVYGRMSDVNPMQAGLRKAFKQAQSLMEGLKVKQIRSGQMMRIRETDEMILMVFASFDLPHEIK